MKAAQAGSIGLGVVAFVVALLVITVMPDGAERQRNQLEKVVVTASYEPMKCSPSKPLRVVVKNQGTAFNKLGYVVVARDASTGDDVFPTAEPKRLWIGWVPMGKEVEVCEAMPVLFVPETKHVFEVVDKIVYFARD